MKYTTTDKLNNSTETEVFKCKSDGNTVMIPYVELRPYAENVYLPLSGKNEHGNEDDSCFHVTCRVESVYFSYEQYSRRFLNREDRREEATAYYRNWITNTSQGVERGAFTRLISVRVLGALELNTAPLTQAHKTYRKKQEQRRREQGEKKAEEHRAREEQHQLLLDEQRQKFLDGERITGGVFLKITERDGLDIHIRTEGMFNRHVKGIDRNGIIGSRKIKGHRISNFIGCHKVMPAYLVFITEKEGKQQDLGQ